MSRDQNEPVIPQIGSFYSRWLSNNWLIFVLTELVVVGIIAGIFVLITNVADVALAMLASVVALIFIESAAGYFLLRHALRPVDIIVRCLAYERGEPTALALPDRNNPKFVKSGLSLLLNAIFENNNQEETTPTANADQQLLQDLLASLPVGFIAIDSRGHIVASNSLAPIRTETDGQREIQLDFTDANNSLDTWLKQIDGNEIEAEKIWSHIQNVAPDQPERRVFDVIAHYRQGRPGNIETVVITVDRTAEYWGEEDNSDFVALAAHELRGPITVIRGYLDILDEQLGPQMTREQHELIDRLNVSAKRLASYVNNILNASRYDHKHMKLQLSETTLDSIVSDIKDDMDLRASTQGRSITWQIPHQLPTVAADRSSVSEVLSNLIDNAIKYSHDGGQIEISAAEQDGFVAISVRDHGIGIPAVVANNLFSKFYRSHRSRDSVGGTGIGLFISRGIVESHGGHIDVESTEGEGSTFTFTLPIYSTVADKLASDNNSNDDLIREGGSWIRNHSRIQE
jgi:signal transduction histidine kinase